MRVILLILSLTASVISFAQSTGIYQQRTGGKVNINSCRSGTVIIVDDKQPSGTEDPSGPCLHNNLDCIHRTGKLTKEQIDKLPTQGCREIVTIDQQARQTRGGCFTGIVTDSIDKEPIIGAVVRITQNGKKMAGSVTDYDGRYKTDVLRVGRYDIRIEYTGMKTVLIPDVLLSSTDARVNIDVALSGMTISCSEVKVLYSSPCFADKLNKKQTDKLPAFSCGNVIVVDDRAIQRRSGGNVRLDGSREEGALWIIDGVQIDKTRFSEQNNRTVPDSLPASTPMVLATTNSFRVYPNPSEGFVHVSSQQPDGNICVTDMTGRILMQQTVTTSTTTLDMSRLPASTYLITHRNKEGRSTSERLVLTH